eukprot:scpid72560/ scgid13596/ 
MTRLQNQAQKKLKSPGLQAQFATNETVSQKVDAAISVLPDSASETKELLTQGKNEICKRQKQLKIADSFEWESVRVYEERSVGDSLADGNYNPGSGSNRRCHTQVLDRNAFNTHPFSHSA